MRHKLTFRKGGRSRPIIEDRDLDVTAADGKANAEEQAGSAEQQHLPFGPTLGEGHRGGALGEGKAARDRDRQLAVADRLGQLGEALGIVVGEDRLCQ